MVWRDLDALGHVNNSVYATYLETGRIEYFTSLTAGQVDAFQLILAELTISYKSPAMLGETLLIGHRVTEMRNSSFIMEAQIEEKQTGRFVATSRAVLVHYNYGENKSQPIPQTWRDQIGQFEGRTF